MASWWPWLKSIGQIESWWKLDIGGCHACWGGQVQYLGAPACRYCLLLNLKAIVKVLTLFNSLRWQHMQRFVYPVNEVNHQVLTSLDTTYCLVNFRALVCYPWRVYLNKYGISLIYLFSRTRYVCLAWLKFKWNHESKHTRRQIRHVSI